MPTLAPRCAQEIHSSLHDTANATQLQLADKIVATLGTDPAVIAAAAVLVAAEKNFNPFAVTIPSLCSDASLPATAELRGIVPLVDPAVTGSDVENANSAKSLANPFSATGLSVAEVAAANGFSNFTAQALDGTNAAAPAAGAAAGAAAGSAAGNNTANAGNNNKAGNNKTGKKKNKGNKNAGATATAAVSCGAVRTLTTVVVAAPTATATAAAGNANNTGGAANNSKVSTIAGLDFGTCVPTIKFVGGLGNRPATEFTFQSLDPVIAANQQEALNPNIITNRICDELTNICAANQAAKDACLAAKAQILALGTRNAQTAEKWNELLGFAGVDVSQN